MRRLGVAALLSTMTACSLFTSLSGFDKGDVGTPADEAGTGSETSTGTDSGAPASDAGTDAIAVADGSDATMIDGGTQLVANGTFETGDCAPFMYNAAKATIGASQHARNGTFACMVCNTGAAMGTAGIWQEYPGGTLGPGKYTFDAWVKTDGDAGNALAQAQVTVKTNGGAARYPTVQTTTSTVGFAQLHVVIDVAADEFIAGFFVALYSETTGPCVVFDDVSLVKSP